ncbi:hypothetical protein P0Y35_18335 [Kiritimatiellaeota bacterium B1221]|nr:hypothetical protein [Kiritimatiellaeota bacterium B1221]
MNFKRYGTSYHPILKTADDLKASLALDESLWVATSAPIHAFRMDKDFLHYLDSDADLRVKCGELEEAVLWMFLLLRDASGVNHASTTLHQDHLNPEHPEAQNLRDLLKQISPDKKEVSLQEIRQWRKRLEDKPVSENGVVLPDAAQTDETKAFLHDLLSVLDGTDHPSGKKGATREVLDRFQTLATARLSWLDRLDESDELDRSLIQPLGDDTAEAHAIYLNVKPAIEHYFRLCDAVNLDPASKTRSWPGLPADLNWENAEAVDAALRNAPLAAPNPERILKFNKELNPAWARDLHDFRQKVIIPLLDKTDEVMNPQIWADICKKMDGYGKWQAEEPGKELAPLSKDRLLEMTPPGLREQILALIDHQKESAINLKEIRQAEKLALYQGLLLEFANNFIAFPHLYNPKKRAGFEMGSLIMDGRRFNLSVQVPDRAAYLKGIDGGTMFIMIVELTHTQRKEKFDIAVPATSGQQGNLKVGKHGVFQHVDGSQWFATVVHIADNPISIGEAMLEPFKRLGKAVTQKVESITQSAEKKLEQSGGEVVTQIQTAPTASAAAPAAAPSGNMLAGGGIAIAALGSSFAFITKIFAELQPVGVLKGLAAAVLAVLIPSSIVAWLRLSKRDLSVLLEGAGWAINSRMRLNATQCRSFTTKPQFPEGSKLYRDREWWLWRTLWVVAAIFLIQQIRH